jgi:hypothetical protein
MVLSSAPRQNRNLLGFQRAVEDEDMDVCDEDEERVKAGGLNFGGGWWVVGDGGGCPDHCSQRIGPAVERRYIR